MRLGSLSVASVRRENTVLIWRYLSHSLAVRCTSNSRPNPQLVQGVDLQAWRLARGNMIRVIFFFVKHVWSAKELQLVTQGQ
jgi:hypothetical protein